MELRIITSEGISHKSYFLVDNHEALVIDPRRDCEVYTELARQFCAKITYILETHRNEDYVIGSLELQELTGAEIAHSKATPFKYGEHRLGDGDTLNLGRLRVEAVYTPGHTNDSICYVVSNPALSKEPLMVFTGDTLFAGDVGRTDLPGLDFWQELSEKLYHSLHDKLIPLGNHVIIYPGHGAGTICGSKLSDRNISTIGYERLTNPIFQLDKEAFVKHMMAQELYRPPYFRKMEVYNLDGPPLLREAPTPKNYSVEEFAKAAKSPNAIVLDTRLPGAFSASHIPGALNIGLNDIAYFPGWVINHDQQILLVLEQLSDFPTAKTYLQRLGYDNIGGYLCPNISAWRNKGRPTDSLFPLTAVSLKQKLDKKELSLIDVREQGEWDRGHIAGAKHIYVGHLPEQADSLPHDKPLAVICGSGRRASLAASLLKRKGFENVYNVLGGMNSWTALGYPTVN